MKNLIKRVARRVFGISGKKVPANHSRLTTHKFVPDANQKFLWIQQLEIKTVLDIGAHEGKTAIQFLSLFPDANIHSFEPIPECYSKLVEKTKNEKRCKTYNLAIGETGGTIEFHQSSYSPSSSILPMAKAHEEAFPFTEGGKKVSVNVTSLDSFASQNTFETPLAMKIDVQGYEWQVLKGAINTLKNTKLILIETSFVELYKDQKLFSSIYEMLIQQGFVYVGSFDQLFNPNNGKPIQQDAIFIRN